MKDTLSERDTLAQPNTRLQEKGHTAPLLQSQHTAADLTLLTAPVERLHDGEAQPSEDLTLAKLLVHKGITRSKHNTNSKRLYGEGEKAQLECGVGQDSACVS